MTAIYPCLWFDGNAEQAAEFYTSLFPDSHIDKIWRSPAGGDDFTFNEAVSLVYECEDQAEVDTLWAALTADGGEPGPCGWLKDRFGLSWQIVPKELNRLMDDPDPERARRAMEAMLQMGKIEVDELRAAADNVAVGGTAG
jgi:predicted 3-demethylubiquinone-9 3-methyltransferase (glyoxalase superfamily)